MSIKIITEGAIQMLIKRCFGPFRRTSGWLEKTQWYDSEKLRDIQSALLRRIIKHSYISVPYYRRCMDSLGIRPNDIQDQEDLQILPILKKNQIIEAGFDMVSNSFYRRMLYMAPTSGTTGTPLSLYRDPASIANEHAFVRRQWKWSGLNIKDCYASLKGRLAANPGNSNYGLYAYDPFMKELVLSSYHLNSKTTPRYIEAMKKYKVRAIIGYPSAVLRFAKLCDELGLSFELKAVLTTSENSSMEIGLYVRRIFGCDVYDFYGSAERVCYIFTCPRGSYHLIPEYGLTELQPINANEPRRCRVISTGFWNMAMPLLRYDQDDIIITSKNGCSCGRAFPVIEMIEGREAEYITTPSGRKLGAAILAYILDGTSNIIESQIVQDSPNHISLRYVPGRGFNDKHIAGLHKYAGKYLPAEMNVDFIPTDTLERTASGKVRWVISKLDNRSTTTPAELLRSEHA